MPSVSLGENQGFLVVLFRKRRCERMENYAWWERKFRKIKPPNLFLLSLASMHSILVVDLTAGPSGLEVRDRRMNGY